MRVRIRRFQEFEHGVGGLPHERGVDEALVRSGHAPEFVREGEGEEVVTAGQEPLSDPFEPVLGPIVLAFGTVAVAAGVVAVRQGATVVAAVERSTEDRGATVDDVAHGPPVGGQERSGVGPQILGPRPAEDVRQFHHRPMVSGRWFSNDA